MSFSNSIGQVTDSLVEQSAAQGVNCNVDCVSRTALITIAGLALLVIGCVGAAGAFPNPSIGWTTAGLAGGIFAISLSVGDLNNPVRRLNLIAGGLATVAFITIGALGGTGILSATQVGWGIIGISLTSMVAQYCLNPIRKRLISQQFVLQAEQSSQHEVI